MHDPVSYEEFLAEVAGPLGGFFVVLAAMNLIAAARTIPFAASRGKRGTGLSSGCLWLLLAIVFAGLAGC